MKWGQSMFQRWSRKQSEHRGLLPARLLLEALEERRLLAGDVLTVLEASDQSNAQQAVGETDQVDGP